MEESFAANEKHDRDVQGALGHTWPIWPIRKSLTACVILFLFE